MHYVCKQIALKRKDNGKELFLTKFSCPASRQHKNILMVHGLTYTQHVFDIKYKDYSTCEYLAKNGYHVWRIDLGGYGKSEKYDNGWDVTTQNAAEDTITAFTEIVKLQKVKNVDLLGWSWGTMITAKAASQRPELIHKVIWLGPCFGGVFEPVEVSDPFSDLSYSYVIRVWQHVPGSNGLLTDFNTVEPELHDMWVDLAYTQDIGHCRPNGGAKEIMEIGDGWLIDNKAVKSPVLIVAGDNDFYVNVDRCYQAKSELPDGSELLFLKGAGHAMYLEKNYYKKTREAILEFIKN